MTRRVLAWAGIVVTVVAVTVLGVYFVMVGLDKADKLASVVGALLAVVGSGVAVYGLLADRNATGGGREASGVSQSGGRSITIGGDNSGIVSTGDDATNIQTP